MTSSGASYPPPTSIVPIFSPSLFPAENEPLFQGQANNLYLRTANVNQSSGGTKTFSDLRSSDIAFTAPGKPLRWESGSGFGVSRLTPIPSVLFDKSYRLPVDDNYTVEELVGRQSSQTLINKTIGSFQTSSPSGTQFYVSTPPLRANQIDPHFAIYTKTVTPGASTQFNILNFSDGTDYLRQIFTLHLSGGLQNLATMFAASFTFSIFGPTPNLGVVTRTYDSGNNITLYSNSASNVLTLGVNLPNNQTGRFSYTLTVYPSSTIEGGVNATKMYTIQQI